MGEAQALLGASLILAALLVSVLQVPRQHAIVASVGCAVVIAVLLVRLARRRRHNSKKAPKTLVLWSEEHTTGSSRACKAQDGDAAVVVCEPEPHPTPRGYCETEEPSAKPVPAPAQSLLRRGSDPCSAGPEPEPSSPRGQQVKFRQTVSWAMVQNLSQLSRDAKAHLWWQAEDFAEFLKVRVAVGRAYRDVAKRRGVPVDSFFPAEPSLAHESRRGLGLGRKQKREKNRRNYIKAVLDEQARQREQRADDSWVLDAEKISRVAARTSEQDRLDAIVQADKDYELFLKTEMAEAKQPDQSAGTENGIEAESMLPTAVSLEFPPTPSENEDLQMLPDEGQEPDPEGEERLSYPKGFGFSRDDLTKAGVSASGHLMRRTRGRARLAEDSEDSDVGLSDASGDSDCGDTDFEVGSTKSD